MSHEKVEDQPLSRQNGEIREFAKAKGLDSRWLFSTLNAIASYRASLGLFASIPDEAVIPIPNDTFHLGKDRRLKDALENMILGSYDDDSMVPVAEGVLKLARVEAELFEERFGLSKRRKRLSPVYEWLAGNAAILARLNEYGLPK